MTSPSYRLSVHARRTLTEIFDYTRQQHGQAQATRYLRGLKASFEHLAQFPKMAPAALPSSAIRIALYREHRIFYTSTTAGIEIGAILHQAQDFTHTLARLQQLLACAGQNPAAGEEE
jgi:plasmid stabilization system protein ParE